MCEQFDLSNQSQLFAIYLIMDMITYGIVTLGICNTIDEHIVLTFGAK